MGVGASTKPEARDTALYGLERSREALAQSPVTMRWFTLCALLVAGCTGQIEPELNPCESMIVLALVLDERGVVTHDSAGTVVLQWAERRTIAEFHVIDDRCVVAFSR